KPLSAIVDRIVEGQQAPLTARGHETGTPHGKELCMGGRSPLANRTLTLSLAVAVGITVCGRVHAQESWDAIYLAGSKIGYTHTFVEKVKNRGRDYLRVRIDSEQRFKRDRDVTITRLTYGTIETPDGQVLRLDTLTSIGEQKLRGHGDVINGE